MCSAASDFRFEALALRRHRALYYACRGCGSLFVADPSWLADVYAYKGVHIDVGQVSRSVRNWLILNELLPILGIGREAACVDFGGGEGLLTRLMRDNGWRFRCHDPYHPVLFADAFTQPDLNEPQPELITAFEVFEHFAAPREELARLLQLRPRALVFSTWFYEGQDSNWIYLVPEVGQHIFFWSRRAMRQMADAHGMTLLTCPWLGVLLSPNISAATAARADTFLQSLPTPFASLPAFMRDAVFTQTPLQIEDQAAGERLFLETVLPRFTAGAS